MTCVDEFLIRVAILNCDSARVTGKPSIEKLRLATRDLTLALPNPRTGSLCDQVGFRVPIRMR